MRLSVEILKKQIASSHWVREVNTCQRALVVKRSLRFFSFLDLRLQKGGLKTAGLPHLECELNISCTKLRGAKSGTECDPICVIERNGDFEYDQEDWSEVFRTERLTNSLNPNFQERFRIKFFPDHDISLRFIVLDLRCSSGDPRDSFLGQMTCRLSEIVDSPPLSGKDVEEHLDHVKRVLFTRPLRDPLVPLFIAFRVHT